MSMTYWGITGFGVCLTDIDKYLNKEKVNKFVRLGNPSMTFEDDVFDDYTFYGDPYNNLAEFLCEFDDKNILTYDDNGENDAYLLYVPPYPWRATKNEPKSQIELEDYILSILRKVYDADDYELRKSLDYINTWGCG